ncbi:MAG: GAF domain-containing protein [Gemmatimonadales bacterium]|nr:GAF domain-containing protein [Gemmatimonadales bacterium]
MGISLIPLLVINGVGYFKALESRQKDVNSRLLSASEERLLDLEEFFADQFEILDPQANAICNQQFLERLSEDLDVSGQETRQWVGSERWRNLVVVHGVELVNLLKNNEFQDILLVDNEGRVLYSSQEFPELGLNLGSGRLVDTPLGRTFHMAIQDSVPVFSGFFVQNDLDDPLLGYLAQQIKNKEGRADGVLLFRLSSKSLTEIVERNSLLGVSGETYVVNHDLVLLTEIRKQSGEAAVGDRILTELTLEWARQDHLAQDLNLIRISGQEESSKLVTEYRGPGNEMVLGNWRTLEVSGRHLGVITEVDKEAAFAGLKDMRLGMALLLIVVSLLVALAGLMVSHRIAVPITSLTGMMQRVADGHMISELPISGPNEVGRLGQQFGIMLKALNEANTTNDRQYLLQKCQFELNEKMRGEPDMATLASSVLEYIGEFYSAQVGAFYLSRAGGKLVLAASFGLVEESVIANELSMGQGIVGKAAQQGRSRVLHNLPPGHLPVRTGMGESSPTSLIIAPFLLDGQVKGVMELGTFGEFAEDDLEFLHLSSESVAMALGSARSRQRVHRLLEETRRQAGILSRQQKELQVTNAQLARSDQYKTEFLANMSHELRTPLNSMLIMSQILAENQPNNLDEDQVVAAETINKAGISLLAIINDILDLSRVEAGKLEINNEPLDLRTFLNNHEALFRPMADEMGLELKVTSDLGLPTIFHSDEGRVSQILNNLLGNALKFTDEGSVVLHVYRPGPGELVDLGEDDPDLWLAFSVADTGRGMKEDEIAQVFEAFNQGDGSIRRKFGGSGLGLTISQKLADLLGGRIRLKSQENEGSTFTLYLPLTPSAINSVDDPMTVVGEMKNRRLQAAEVAPIGSGAQICSGTKGPSGAENSTGESWKSSKLLQERRILICDQDMRTVFKLTSGLEHLGATVRLARTWEDALVGAQDNPDLALVDPSWWDLDPVQAADQLKENSTQGGFPMITLMDREKMDQGPEWSLVLAKPVDMEQLMEFVAEIPLNEPVYSGT